MIILGFIISISFVYFALSKQTKATIIAKENIIESFSPFHKVNGAIELDSSYENNLYKLDLDFDTTGNKLIVSDTIDVKNPFLINIEDKKVTTKVFSGKRINIAVTGVDSRLGVNYKHADANHIISLLPEQGVIEIFSVPRDTYADAGFEEDTLQRFNILANVLGGKGRKAYLKELARIAEIDHIHFYVELGFSQAIGIIENLGFNDAKSTLRLLRDRKSYRIGDFQRSYNQGHFIKGAILKVNDLAKNSPDLIFNIFLELVNTNLSKPELLSLSNSFRNLKHTEIHNFVKPKVITDYQVIDLFNKTSLDSLLSTKNYSNDSANSALITNKLTILLNEAEKHPNNQMKINRLKRYFEQKSWLQISNKQIRNKIKYRFKDILSQAYIALGKFKEAQSIISIDYY